MKKALFRGMATAMITPMTPEGIDYDTLGRFIEFQIENGINALVVMGTTGENATIAPRDQEQVTDWENYRKSGRTEVLLNLRANCEEVRTCTVHLINVTDTRYIVLISLTPYGLRLWLNTTYSTECSNCAVEYTE